MSKEIEIEYKNLLTNNEFELLKNRFTISQEDFISQENHYFDTLTFSLKAHQSALRIRKKQDKYILTLKQPLKQGLLETHQSITKEQAAFLLNGGSLQQIDGEIQDALIHMGIDPAAIKYLGCLKTDRAEVKDGENLLVLDHSFYLNHEDYELEYEVKEPIQGKQRFLEILKQNDIPIRPTKNKILRFFQTKLEMRERPFSDG